MWSWPTVLQRTTADRRQQDEAITTSHCKMMIVCFLLRAPRPKGVLSTIAYLTLFQRREKKFLAAVDEGPEPVLSIAELMASPIGADGKPRRPTAAIGFSVVGLLAQGDRVHATDSQNSLRVASRQENRRYDWVEGIKLMPPKVGGATFPAGIARQGQDFFWVCSSRGNSIQLVDLAAGRVKQRVPVGVAPYTVCCPRPDRCYVTNWGGDPPKKDEPQALSSGTPVRIDPRGIANQGTVSILGYVLGKWDLLKTIHVGLHPSGMTTSPKGMFVYVANATNDNISIIDAGHIRLPEHCIVTSAAFCNDTLLLGSRTGVVTVYATDPDTGDFIPLAEESHGARGLAGRAPAIARSLTVPQIARRPMSPPGKKSGETTCESVVTANRVSPIVRTAESSRRRGAAFPNSGRKSRLSRSRLKVPPEP